MTEILDTDNQFYRGSKFEIMFGEFMKSDLGWTGYVIRSQQKGKFNSRGANVDVIGVKTDERYSRYNKLGWTIWAIGLIIECIGVILALWTKTELLITIIVLILGLGIMVVGVIFLVYRERFCDKHGWVECKNLKGKVPPKEIQKTVSEIQDQFLQLPLFKCQPMR